MKNQDNEMHNLNSVKSCATCKAQLTEADKICPHCSSEGETSPVWPPPIKSDEKPDEAVEDKTKPYLTGNGWLDAIAGLGTGFVFYWFVLYGVVNGILSHFISNRMSFFFHAKIGCFITLLVSLLILLRMRLRYPVFANSMFFAGLLLNGLILYIFQPM